MDRKQYESSPGAYLLSSGHILCTRKAQRISAVLGSSVAVCLYDNHIAAGGICNFLYPFIKDPRRATAQYGNAATQALIKLMLAEGCRKDTLEAQIFGGARNPGLPTVDIGYENIRMARGVLAKYGVRVVSEDVGGRVGRKIIFDIGKNEITVLHVDSLRETDWYPYAKRHILLAGPDF